MANITPFEQAKRDLYAGKISAPNVTYKGRSVPYFRSQLAAHIYSLKIMDHRS
ncbi:MAG: hypothetical protein KatS3mg035_1076 [Bacteroidia bacterium]|nr:MAG: hypothetical protein KatS3mg035_1076 [Bacteroidia bacterium]